MVQNVVSLHNLTGGDEVKFPFAPNDYQRYVFGDDRLAHRFGRELAKVFIPTLSNSRDDLAVAVLSETVPTATHRLRDHFVACLNRHLIANNASPALKIDFHSVGSDTKLRDGPPTNRRNAYHIDTERLQNRTLIVLADFRTGQAREDLIRSSFGARAVTTIFAYLASLDQSTTTTALTKFLSSVLSPSIKEIENIVQPPNFVMNECFVRFVLGREYSEFCPFIRRQDDHFVRLLLDHAINGHYHDDQEHAHNVQFLLWEVEARESM